MSWATDGEGGGDGMRRFNEAMGLEREGLDLWGVVVVVVDVVLLPRLLAVVEDGGDGDGWRDVFLLFFVFLADAVFLASLLPVVLFALIDWIPLSEKNK